MRDKIKNDIESYYNERAQEYDEIYMGKGHTTLDSATYLEDVAKTSEIVSQFGRGHLLDIACGTGFWLQDYCRNCSEITLLDQSEKMLEQCKRRVEERGLLESTHFIQGDFLDVNLEPSTFDSVFVGFLLSHLTIEQEKVFFKNLKEILRPHGQLMIVDSAWNDQRHKYTKKEGIQKRFLNDGRTFTVYKRYFEKSDIEKMCRAYDFRIEFSWSGTAFITAILERVQ